MLSDIQEANGRQKLGLKILVTALDTYQKDPSVEAKYSNLKDIVDRRLLGAKPSTHDLNGNSVLDHGTADLEVFRTLILTDD